MKLSVSKRIKNNISRGPAKYQRRLTQLIYAAIVFSLVTGLSSCSQSASGVRNCIPTKGTFVYSPAIDLQNLFSDVQKAGLYPDSKTFADATPFYPPDSLTKWYNTQKTQAGFDLKTFVEKNFDIPEMAETKNTNTWNKDILHHLNTMWGELERKPDKPETYSSRLPLSFPYVVPGGRFREIYYWDSYFTMEGLAESGRMDLVRDMLDNFDCLIERYSFIPNGTRSYYLSRSQPPFFAEMVKLYMQKTSDTMGLSYLTALENEYNFWMRGGNTAISQHVVEVQDYVLNRYWDRLSEPRSEAYREDTKLAEDVPEGKRRRLYQNLRSACESGWDFSSRWLTDPDSLSGIHTTDILPVDLNCLLYNLENMLARLYQLDKKPQLSQLYARKADNRKKAINAVFWSERDGFYYDYDFRKDSLTHVVSVAAVYPLYFHVADTVQAHKVAEKLKKELLKPGGLVTTPNHTGQQWDAPNGWAPLQWMAVCGLENYGETELAKEIATRWMALNKKVYEETGKMMEKYNVEDLNLEAGGGEYPTQDGFGWTNGVYLGLWAKYGR